MRQRWTPVIVRGEVVDVPLRMKDGTGAPVNLTGATVTLRIAGTPAPMSVTVQDAANGLLKIRLTGTANGRYPYEVVVNWEDGQKWCILLGEVVVEEGTYAE